MENRDSFSIGEYSWALFCAVKDLIPHLELGYNIDIIDNRTNVVVLSFQFSTKTTFEDMQDTFDGFFECHADIIQHCSIRTVKTHSMRSENMSVAYEQSHIVIEEDQEIPPTIAEPQITTVLEPVFFKLLS